MSIPIPQQITLDAHLPEKNSHSLISDHIEDLKDEVYMETNENGGAALARDATNKAEIPASLSSHALPSSSSSSGGTFESSSGENSLIEADQYSSSDGSESTSEQADHTSDKDDALGEISTQHEPEGTDKELKGAYTATIIGLRYITRPIDTCIGAGWVPGNGLRNRTFANEYIAVAKSPLQGFGVFAAADIEEHAHILLEEPLLRIKGQKELYAEHARLSGEERAIYDGLAGYHQHHTCQVFRKWSANQFLLSTGCGGVFAIASNFNHACASRRNAQYFWDQRRQVMTFTATKAIEAGEEVLISYGQYRHILYTLYGFVCRCGGCDYQEHRLAANLQF